ncbi:uncharacterized protein LOC126746876 [Anthonomus grandis grandis]|uniref:uncharacterized protein LOC126746876 n=1 Tax=Anthonomus grandis grandis TaxID=2921223 RepID=UPI00216548FF|nr:uncharacterized protein LOC126746876 [Anthonomus grandis grandis]
MASPQLRDRMIKILKKHQNVFIGELVVVQMLIVYNLIYVYNRTEEFVSTFNWIYHHKPGLVQFGQHLMMLDIFFMGLPMMAAMWYAQYVCISLGAQMYMLEDQLRYIKVTKEELVGSYVASEERQQYIKEFLKFFIKRHQSILSYANFVNKINSFYNFFYLLCAFCIWLSMVLIIFRKYDLFMTISGNVTFWAIITITMNDCETFEDASRQLSQALYNSPFYLWNEKNMKTLMIAHQYLSSRVIQVPMVSFIVANMGVVKWFAKAMYSAFNIYRTMNSK